MCKARKRMHTAIAVHSDYQDIAIQVYIEKH